MIMTFNAVHKDNIFLVDVVLADPYDYDLEQYYIWFDVNISTIANTDISKSDFTFYLFDSNKIAHNPISLRESPHFTNTNSKFSLIIGFELESDYFYNAPTVGYCFNGQEKIELIKLLY